MITRFLIAFPNNRTFRSFIFLYSSANSIKTMMMITLYKQNTIIFKDQSRRPQGKFHIAGLISDIPIYSFTNSRSIYLIMNLYCHFECIFISHFLIDTQFRKGSNTAIGTIFPVIKHGANNSATVRTCVLYRYKFILFHTESQFRRCVNGMGTMPGLYPLKEMVSSRVLRLINQIHARLVQRHRIQRG